MPVLAGLPTLGPMELLLVLAVVVIIFGVGRLPEVGGALGKSIREFRKATKEDEDAGKTNVRSAADEPEATAADTGSKASGGSSGERMRH